MSKKSLKKEEKPKKKRVVDSSSDEKKESNKLMLHEERIEKALIQNFVSLQKVITNLSINFEGLSDKISRLLDIFEISARSLAEKDFDFTADNEEIRKKLDTLVEQNKIIAKGLTLLHEGETITSGGKMEMTNAGILDESEEENGEQEQRIHKMPMQLREPPRPLATPMPQKRGFLPSLLKKREEQPITTARPQSMLQRPRLMPIMQQQARQPMPQGLRPRFPQQLPPAINPDLEEQIPDELKQARGEYHQSIMGTKVLPQTQIFKEKQSQEQNQNQKMYQDSYPNENENKKEQNENINNQKSPEDIFSDADFNAYDKKRNKKDSEFTYP